MPDRAENEAAWRAIAIETANGDEHARRWYRGKKRSTWQADGLASEYERLLREAHSVRVLLLRRDGV